MLGEIQKDELMLRAIYLKSQRPDLDFWEDDGRPSPAAFKKKDGISVDRTANRTIEEAVQYIRGHKEGAIVSITVLDCLAAEIYIDYCPNNHNPYHCVLCQSKTELKLSPSQARKLSRVARIEYMPMISFA